MNIVASDMNIRFLGVVKVGPARVVARVVKRGRRSVVVQADVIDVGDDRRLVATSTLSYAPAGRTVTRAPSRRPPPRPRRRSLG